MEIKAKLLLTAVNTIKRFAPHPQLPDPKQKKDTKDEQIDIGTPGS